MVSCDTSEVIDSLHAEWRGSWAPRRGTGGP